MIHDVGQMLRKLIQHLRRVDPQLLRNFFDMLTRGRARQRLAKLLSVHRLVGAIADP